MPPVLVRGGMPDMAVRRTKRSLPKRRFDVALNVPGAELRLPSLPLIQPGWRAFSGILAVMMIACLFMMWKSPAFQVNSVEAEGLVRLTVGDLNTVMNIMGGSIFSIDPPAVEQTLSRLFPELAEISVKVSLPARVLVQARERQPVLSWYQDEREVWVDADGVAFIPRGNPGSLVRVQGHGAAPAAIAEVVIPAVGSLPTAPVNTGGSTSPDPPLAVRAAIPPTVSRSPALPSSSESVMTSIGSRRVKSATIARKMRACAGR